MRLFRSILIMLLLVPGWSGLPRRDVLGARAQFDLTPVRIRPNGGGIKVGALTFLAGYRMTSSDPAFGGFSSLLIDNDRFTLLSDGGTIVRFRLRANGQAFDRQFADLSGGPGIGWQKLDRDSESMTRDPSTGRVWVGFEQANAIWRFAPDLARPEKWAKPRLMRGWPENGGAEAMVRLRDGRFLVFSEQLPGNKGRGRAALRFDGDPTESAEAPTRFTYLPPAHYEPTDAAQLPDGRIVLLNRRFTWGEGFTAVLTVIDPASIRAGGMVVSREIARFAGDVLHDNFEGLAVTQENGATMLWVVSDDNQSAFQQTLLLKFRLDPAPAAMTAAPRR